MTAPNQKWFKGEQDNIHCTCVHVSRTCVHVLYHSFRYKEDIARLEKDKDELKETLIR